MAIEITKRGTPATYKKYDARCNSCKTDFTFQPGDAHYEHDQRDGDFYRIDCPVCGRECTRSAS